MGPSCAVAVVVLSLVVHRLISVAPLTADQSESPSGALWLRPLLSGRERAHCWMWMRQPSEPSGRRVMWAMISEDEKSPRRPCRASGCRRGAGATGAHPVLAPDQGGSSRATGVLPRRESA